MSDRNDRPGGRSVGAVKATHGKRKGLGWLWPLLIGLLLLALLLFGLSRCGNDDDSNTLGAAPTGPATTGTSPSPTASATTEAPQPTLTSSVSPSGGGSPSGSTSPSGGTGGTTGAAGNLTANGVSLLPLATAAGAGGDLSRFTGQAAKGTGVLVESVVADEGFWVGTSATDRVWVQLTNATGESPFQVKKGDVVDFTGTVTANTAGFASSVGVTAAEGADQLTAQKQHLAVPRSAIKTST